MNTWMPRALALPALLLAMACHPGGGQETASRAGTEAALQPRPVHLVQPDVREEHPEIPLTGEIRAFESVPVPAQVAGSVDRVLTEVGRAVAAGDPLAEIDRETYRLRAEQAAAEVKAAEADLELARRELERKRDLLSDQTISQAVFDQAKARHDLAQARLEAARAARRLAQQALERSVVRAPAAGRVAARHVSPGQWVEVGQAVVDLATGGKLKVAAEVPEGWAGKLQGLTSFSFTVGNGGPLAARVHSVQPVVSSGNRAFELTGVFTPPPGATIRPGMFATVTLASPEAVRSLWVPATAVAISEMPVVMLVRDGKAVRRKVLTGRTSDGSIEILQGLEPEEQVVEDLSGLSDGIPVEVH